MNLVGIKEASYTLCSCIDRAANVYVGSVNFAAECTAGILECSAAVLSSIEKSASQGFVKMGKEIAASCLGLSDFEQAKEAFNNRTKREKKTEIFEGTDGRQRQMTYVANVPRPFSERVGSSLGHTADGVCKLTTSLVGTGGAAAYTLGSTYNLLGKEAVLGTFTGAAQMMASVINGGAALSAKAVGKVGMAVLEHPSATWNLLGAGTLLYGAASEVQKAAASEGTAKKTFHAAAATFFAVQAVLFTGLID